MFGPEHYSARACELEHQAKYVGDANLREGCLNLARVFRQMANLASLAQSADDAEAIRPADRMVGKTSGTLKQ
jgi:hypothetical protein